MEADCVWRDARLIAELDGRAVHGTVAAFERDRARDRALNAAGWRVVTHHLAAAERGPAREPSRADIGVPAGSDDGIVTFDVASGPFKVVERERPMPGRAL